MTDNYTNDEIKMQTVFNEYVYKSMIAMYNEMSVLTDASRAYELMIQALAVNLGAFLAQLPATDQQRFAEYSHSVIDNTITAVSKNIGKEYWGFIGHA